jgi:hypothetical protein
MGELMGIPRVKEEITPQWLTAALRAGGALAEGRVASVDAVALSEGVGFIGQVLRLTPTYDGAPKSAPASIIAKLPTTDPGGRQIAAMYGLYERELLFYRGFSERVTFRVPLCYYGDGDAATVAYVLLLEDLGGSGRLGDQVEGCSFADAKVAVAQLARHHAAWWEHEVLDDPWMASGIDLVRTSMTQAYPASWQRFLELFGSRFSADIVAAIPTLDAWVLKSMDEYEAGPFTVAHGDYRADNLFFGREDGSYDLAVLDWQSFNRGWGTYDLAYFICGSFATELRQEHERALCDLYYETLIANGVAGYSRSRFDEDYARSLLIYLAIFVVSGATIDTANDRGLALFNAIYDRINGSIADTQALRYI